MIGVEEVKRLNMSSCIVEDREQLLEEFRKTGEYQIKSLLLSHHHSTSALVSEILMSVLQTVQKTTIYIWTVHIYRLYRRQCAKYTYIYSVHIVYYKYILNYQLHITHLMCTSTLCTLSIHYVVYT